MSSEFAHCGSWEEEELVAWVGVVPEEGVLQPRSLPGKVEGVVLSASFVGLWS